MVTPWHLPHDLRYQELDDFRCDRIILVKHWQRADFEPASSQAGDGDAAVGFGQHLHRGGPDRPAGQRVIPARQQERKP